METIPLYSRHMTTSRYRVVAYNVQQTDRLDLPDLAAHAGFLNSARALDDIVSQRIDSYVQTLQNNDKKPHVVFTGHSAGGAVASLLCLRYMSESTYGEVNWNNSPTSCRTTD